MILKIYNIIYLFIFYTTKDFMLISKPSKHFWNWESTDARMKYRSLKNDSKSYYRDANFSLGLILANHLISAADAYWSAKRFNRHVESGFSGVDIKLLPEGGWQVDLSARF